MAGRDGLVTINTQQDISQLVDVFFRKGICSQILFSKTNTSYQTLGSDGRDNHKNNIHMYSGSET